MEFTCHKHEARPQVVCSLNLPQQRLILNVWPREARVLHSAGLYSARRTATYGLHEDVQEQLSEHLFLGSTYGRFHTNPARLMLAATVTCDEANAAPHLLQAILVAPEPQPETSLVDCRRRAG